CLEGLLNCQRNLATKKRRHGVTDLAISRVSRASLNAARNPPASLVCREHETVWEALQPGKLSHREAPAVLVVVGRIALGIQRPCPKLGVQATIGIEMTA